MIRHLKFAKVSPTMTQGELVSWLVIEGQPIEEGTLLYTVQGDKSTTEVESLESGILRKILKDPGSHCSVAEPIAILSDRMDEDIGPWLQVSSEVKPKESFTPEPLEKEASGQKEVKDRIFCPQEIPLAEPLSSYAFPYGSSASIRATPYAKQLAKERSVDLTTVSPKKGDGLIRGEDIPLALSSSYTRYSNHTSGDELPGSYDRLPLSSVQKSVAQRLQLSKQTIPHFYLSRTVDLSSLLSLKAQLALYSIEYTLNDFILRASALALEEHPAINGAFYEGEIIRFRTVDISVAVALQEGLITPIIRLASRKSLEMISKEVKLLVNRAKKGLLHSEEYQGGGFTVSNLGMYKVDEFLPIINPPQMAILGVASVLDNNRMKLTLAADHRGLNGVDAAKFMATLARFLENPAVLLL